MAQLFWLSQEQVARIRPLFPKRGVKRVDDRKVLSGIIPVIQKGLRWVDAPRPMVPTKPSTAAAAACPWPCPIRCSMPLNWGSTIPSPRRGLSAGRNCPLASGCCCGACGWRQTAVHETELGEARGENSAEGSRPGGDCPTRGSSRELLQNKMYLLI